MRRKLELDPRIADSFRKGQRPAIYTVGDLAKELALLPQDLRLTETLINEAMRVVVTNYNDEQFSVSIQKFDFDD